MASCDPHDHPDDAGEMPVARVLLIVPCYNEAQRLPVEQFASYALPGHALRFLFVNDGSRDNTLEVLADLCARAPERLSFLDLPQNGGKAEAVRQGFLHGATQAPDVMGFLDADLATPLSELPRFMEVLDSRPEVELVFGARVQLLGRTIERQAVRHYFGRIFATAASMTLQLPIYDTQCGAKFFRFSPQMMGLFEHPFLSRWIFDVEILARYLEQQRAQGKDPRGAIYELPLREWRDVKGSKVKTQDGFRAFGELARIWWTY